jgi:hypothetical protein
VEVVGTPAEKAGGLKDARRFKRGLWNPDRSEFSMRVLTLAALGLIFLLAACASGGAGGGEDSSQDRYLLTAEDLAPYATYNLYDTVRRLRRFWLQGSGGRSPRLFVNGVEIGGGPSLQEYQSDMVAEIRFIRSADAMTQFGPDYAGGVIQVTLR